MSGRKYEVGVVVHRPDFVELRETVSGESGSICAPVRVDDCMDVGKESC